MVKTTELSKTYSIPYIQNTMTEPHFIFLRCFLRSGNVLDEIMKGLRKSWNAVTIDDWYTSIDLALMLYQKHAPTNKVAREDMDVPFAKLSK